MTRREDMDEWAGGWSFVSVRVPWQRCQNPHTFCLVGITWRIIPFSKFSKWLATMVIVSPLTGFVGPLPNSLNGL